LALPNELPNGSFDLIAENSLRTLIVCRGVTRRSCAVATTGQERKVEKVTHEHKRGTLKSGAGRKVKRRKQAVAIAMSESSQSRKRKTAS
jgi:hypothetical protein